MNKYNPGHLPHTFSSIIISSSIAAISLLTSTPPPQRDASLYLTYRSNALTKTFSQYQSPITGEYEKFTPKNLEQTVTAFYSKLTSTQEPLGEAFEAVLNQNLWDLYEA